MFKILIFLNKKFYLKNIANNKAFPMDISQTQYLYILMNFKHFCFILRHKINYFSIQASKPPLYFLHPLF